MLLRVSVLMFAVFGTSAVCATPASPDIGLASWYGQRYQGRTTASGEPFDMRQLTAAHRSFPFGSRVLVTCPSTGRSVVVRINDRGPTLPGRIIDLSREAARRLGILKAGVAAVVLKRLADGALPRSATD